MIHVRCETPGCHCTEAYIEGLHDSKSAILKRIKEAHLTKEQAKKLLESVVLPKDYKI